MKHINTDILSSTDVGLQGKLRHIALINSNGNIVTDGESERFDRPVNADFEYQDKNIAYVLYKNKNGKPLFRKRYNKKDGKINMFVFEYNDDNGTDKRLPKDLTGYVRLENETAER
jgi:serine/threonine-protein kinase